jgi:hypothetical protein
MKPLLTSSLLCLLAPLAAALEIDRNATRANVLFNGGMQLKTGPGEADAFTLQLRTSLGPAIPLGDQARMSVGLAYDGTALRFDDTAPAFPLPDADLHEIAFPLLARYQRAGSPWTITGGLTPGIATDFDHIDSDDFFLGGRLVFERVMNDHLKLGFGAAVIRSTGRETILPAVGFEWRPADAWLVELAGPYFNIWWQPADPWLVRFGAGPAGGVWNVDWNNLSRDLSFSSFLVGFGVERQLTDQLWLAAAAGASFANRLELTHTGGLTDYKTGLQDGIYALIGLRLAAW